MPARRRTIAVVTGSRAEYGVLQSTLRAIDDHPRLALQLVVTGMHLLPRFGSTVREIERDGWPIAALIPMQRGDGSATDQATGLARGVAEMARFFDRARPDVVLVLGDRIEALAGALAAVTTGRWLAHIHGGDVAEGDLDESIRHAITKLAHLHFPATPAAARRIVRMGEPPARVHCVGAPGLDDLRDLLKTLSPADKAPFRGRGEGRVRGVPPPSRLATRPFALVIQHAYGRSDAIEEQAARAVLDAVAARGFDRRIIYPNTDRGHGGVLRAIEKHAATSRNGDTTVVRSLPRAEFLSLLIDSAFLIGNSSCGIIEAPCAGVPSIDVGDRQAGREVGGRSVIHSPEKKTDMQRAIVRAVKLPRIAVRSGPYGDGVAGHRIAAILARTSLAESRRRKRLTY